MGTGLTEILSELERCLLPMLQTDGSNQFSKEENRILVLQQINRLNQRIGQIGRTSKDQMPKMKALQAQVNNLTIGVKNDNSLQMKNSLNFVKNMVESIESESD